MSLLLQRTTSMKRVCARQGGEHGDSVQNHLDRSYRPWDQFCLANTADVPVNLQGRVEGATGTESLKNIHMALIVCQFTWIHQWSWSLSLFASLQSSVSLFAALTLCLFSSALLLNVFIGNFVPGPVSSTNHGFSCPSVPLPTVLDCACRQLLGQQAQGHFSHLQSPQASHALLQPLAGPDSVLHWPWALPLCAQNILLSLFPFLSSIPSSSFPPLSSGSSHMSPLKLWCLLSSITFSYTCWLHGLRSPLAGPASILMRPALSWTIPLLFPNKYMGTRCLIPALTGFQSRSTLTMRWITIQFGDTLNPACMLVPYPFPLQCASPLCTVALIYASFHHALLYCALKMMHFLQIEGLW